MMKLQFKTLTGVLKTPPVDLMEVSEFEWNLMEESKMEWARVKG